MIVDGVRRDKRRKRESDEVIEAMQNLAGDADLDTQSGLIEVDRTEPSHPVIRFRLDRFKLPEGGGGGSSSASAYPSVYEIEETDTGGHFINRYYEVSGVLRAGPDASSGLGGYAGKFVAIRVSGTTAAIAGYSNLGAMQSDMIDKNLVVMPLYKLDSDGEVEIDLRHVPRADMWSLALSN